jgi:hypothetical protein
MAHQMPTKDRVMLCLVSAIIVFSGLALTGASHPAAKLLHEWLCGVVLIFLGAFTALMAIVLRGRLENSLWAIPASAALSYPAATFAYVTYFLLFEPQRFLNTVGQIRSMEKAVGHGQIFDGCTSPAAYWSNDYLRVAFRRYRRYHLPPGRTFDVGGTRGRLDLVRDYSGD